MSPRSLLIVEDDVPLANLMKDYLLDNGFRVSLALNGAQAIELSQSKSFDVVICDLMLPDIHGFKLAKKLNVEHQCPLIFLTALSDDQTQIEGLELGAADFIAKPVKPPVLLARIKANLRKQDNIKDDRAVQMGPYRLYERTKSLYLDESLIALTNQEFDILWLFVTHSSEPLSREFMFKQIIGRPYDGSDRAADLVISRLRKKLVQLGCGDLTIRTIRGQGYILTLESHA